ncbi:armadillo-type protein, partial [Globomyces pollinis-pini]
IQKECMDIIQNVDEDLESRITACDDFEMLIESMDNANDLESLKLWTPLLNLLSDKEAEIRMYAAWILGTSIQNNEKAKDSFLKNNGLSIMLNCLSSEMDSATRLKILYCLSGTIRNHPSIFEEFQK